MTKRITFPTPDPTGGWRDADGGWYEDLESAIQCGVFNFCGCGDAETNLDHIRESLLAVHNKEDAYKDGATLFTRYWLDSIGLTEHGGSIGGAWLTDDGQKMLQLLSTLPKAEA